MAGRDEVPAPALIAEGDMGTQDAVAAVEIQLDILDMNMIDPVREVQQKHLGIQALPDQMAGIKVDAQGGTAVKGIQELFRAPIVKGNLRGMDLQGQFDTAAVKLVHDGTPQRLDLLIARLHLGLGGLGEGVPELPDGEPMKKVTTSTPMALAARAVFFISSMAQA